MNINVSEIVTENGLRYSYAAVLYSMRGNVDGTSFEKDDTSQTILPIGSTIKTVIRNSLISPVMTGTIIFKDEGGIVASFVGSMNTYCDIQLQMLDGKGVPTGVSFLHKFWVKSTDILEVDGNTCTFKIELLSIHWYTFMSTVQYFEAMSIPGTTHIKKLMSLSGLRADIEPTDYENAAAPFPYILPANCSVLSGIYYCLNRMIEMNESLYFVIYDPFQNKYYPWRFSDEATNRESATSNIATLPSRDAEAAGSMFMMKNVIIQNHSDAARVMNFAKAQTNHTYDYNTGEWKKFSHTAANIIKNSLFQGKDPAVTYPPGYDSRIKPFPTNIGGNLGLVLNETEWSKSASETSIWKKLRDFVCTNNVLSFECQGVLERIPGSNFYITGDTKELESFGAQHSLIGKWTTLQVTHIITPSSYTNQMNLGRMTYIKDISKLL